MRADRSCFQTTRNIHAKQKITMPHNSTSRTTVSQVIIVMARGIFKWNNSNNTKTQSVIGIAQDMSIIWMTRRRFIKVKYFIGFTTAMFRSNTKLHKFAADTYTNSQLIKFTPLEFRPYESHTLAISQRWSEGTAIIPTKKSATANETTKTFVFVRSRCFLQTMKMTNPFPAIVKVEKDQPRIQNQFFIFQSDLLLLLTNRCRDQKNTSLSCNKQATFKSSCGS